MLSCRRLLFLLPLASCALLATACSPSVQGGSTGGGGAGGAAGGSEGTGGGSGGTGTDTDIVCDDPPMPAVFELGTGEKCFSRLTPGQVIPVMQGPQGGFHLWAAMGCSDCPEKVTVVYGLKDKATNDYYPDQKPLKVIAHLQTTGWPQRAGFTDFLPGVVYDEATQLPKGTHVIMEGAILDSTGQPMHQQEVEVELGDKEIWAPPCDSSPTCGAPGGTPCCTK